MDTKNENGRELYFDAIKVFAIALVFALHTQRGVNVTDPCHNFVLYYFARCCMPLLFMVNGALVLRKEEFPFDYYKKKVFQIVRILLIWSVITAFYFLIFHRTPVLQALKEGGKTFLAYQWVTNFWFFYTFFFIYTIMLLAFKQIKKNILITFMILVMISLILAGISLINIHVGGYFVQDMIPQRFRLWTWLLYFILGYILSNIVVDKNKILYTAAAVLTVISIFWQNKLCYELTGQVDSACMYDDLFIIAWCACIFLVFRFTLPLGKPRGLSE